jgi:hypothetical protein
MRHVDDGALHAYLDGALDQAYPSGEARRIREHLEVCQACAGRLDAARALRDEADAVLASAPLEGVTLPSLEDLTREARDRRDRNHDGRSSGAAPSGMWRLAWAASFVVALGAGWLARGATFGPVADTGFDAPSVQAPGAAEFDGRGVEVSAVEKEARDEAPTPGRQAVGRTADALADAGQAASGPPGEEAAVASATATVPDPASVRADAGAPAPPPVSDRNVEGSQVVPRDVAATRERVVASAAAADTEPAHGVPASPGLAHPDLAVLSVEWIDPVEPQAGVRILQALPGGDVLEVIRVTTPWEPSLLPATEPGVAQWVRPLEGGWLVLRGAVGTDSLAVLGGGFPRGS